MTERTGVREAIFEWNAEFSEVHNIVFQPKMWEFDSVPDMQQPAQHSLNKQIIHGSDVLIALFWTRLGTPTEKAESGTLEELQIFMETGKPTALYFSLKNPNLSMINTTQLDAVRNYRSALKGLHHDFKNLPDLKNKIRKYLTNIVQQMENRKLLENDEHQVSVADVVLQSEPESETQASLYRESFVNEMNRAIMSNADGYWLSIVCDYGEGYEQFVSSDKDYIISWGLQLAYRLLGTSSTYSAPVGPDFVRVTVPKEDIHPTNFSCMFHNDGVIRVQWRGDGEFISLAWLLVRCIVSLQELTNHSVVLGKQPIQIGLSISNAPQHGIRTDGVFTSEATRTSFRSMSSHWISNNGELIDIDSFIRKFVYQTLSEWGYKYFEEVVNAMKISSSLVTLTLIDKGLTFGT